MKYVIKRFRKIIERYILACKPDKHGDECDEIIQNSDIFFAFFVMPILLITYSPFIVVWLLLKVFGLIAAPLYGMFRR